MQAYIGESYLLSVVGIQLWSKIVLAFMRSRQNNRLDYFIYLLLFIMFDI